MDKSRLSSQEMWEKGYAEGYGFGPPPYATPETRCGTYEIVRVLRDHLNSQAGPRLLEMGCGGSKYLPWLAKEMGFQTDGVDYSESGCTAARRALASVGSLGEVHCKDFTKLGEEFDEKYDAVASFGVVEHFVNTSEILTHFAATLRPGGVMFTFVPNLQSLAGSLIKRMDRELFNTHKLFDLGEFARYHQEAGLVVEKASYSEWLDFQVLPLNRLPPKVSLVAKNLIHVVNKVRLSAYKRFPVLNPQSSLLCSGMIVVARKPTHGS